MTVHRKWVARNLGFDPISNPPPATTLAFKRAATNVAKPEDFQREIIDFDSESPAGPQFLSFSTATPRPHVRHYHRAKSRRRTKRTIV